MRMRSLYMTAAGVLLALCASYLVLGGDLPSGAERSATAAMPGAQSVAGVRLNLDKTTYRVGEPVILTVVNELPQNVILMSGQSYCSVVLVQHTDGQDWTALGPCAATQTAIGVPIAPNGRATITADSRAGTITTAGPLVGEAIPGVASGPLAGTGSAPAATCTTAQPCVVPEGETSPRRAAFPNGELPPGRYRLAVIVVIESFEAPQGVAYSTDFSIEN